MTLQTVQTFRMASGVWAAIAIAYGVAWPLSFMAPLFATIFLVFPAWVGWRMASQLLFRLFLSLLLGIFISEVLLGFPVICILLYGLLFFFIYYHDTPSAPPFAAMFMTLGITIVPMMGFSGEGLSQFIALAIFVNMAVGLFFAWIFHTLLPNSLAEIPPGLPQKGKPAPPPLPSEEERVRQALTSTIVALTAVIIFFSLNLVAYAYAMIQICFMVGAPNAKASAQALKDNAIACCIGGVAMIIVFNLLVAVPTYQFLLSVTLVATVFFSKKMFGGGPLAKAYISGFVTFLVLLGTSTMVEKIATTNFYLRIGQILFAGIFAIGGLIFVDHLLRPDRKHIFSTSATDRGDAI